MLLIVALLAAAAAIGYTVLQLDDARTQIDEQQRQIDDQQDLLDKKETFGAAMQGLVETAGKYDGLPFASLVPWPAYESLAATAYRDRLDARAIERVTAKVLRATADLDSRLAGASAESASNATGTMNESVIDRLGSGFVTSVVDDADSLCEADVLACVMSQTPYTVHFDADDMAAEHMTDWLRTGVAYHEFAHVLQFTNPEPTDTALAAFGGDWETMADCFALAHLDGWTLDHEVWTSDYSYWEVSIGYGYTCDESQRQVVRDWYSQLAFHTRPITQG